MCRRAAAPPPPLRHRVRGPVLPVRSTAPLHTGPHASWAPPPTTAHKKTCLRSSVFGCHLPPARAHTSRTAAKQKKTGEKIQLSHEQPTKQTQRRLKKIKKNPPAQPHVGRDRNVPDQLFSSFPEIIDIHKCGLLALARGGARPVCQ